MSLEDYYKDDRLEKWTQELTPEQMRSLLVGFIEHDIENEMIRFGDLAPYWSYTG